uniref:AlNc14C281G10110 protein n=1 Tax=Albugo laibachii Nc14 TaxID=890382 RepID=F0WC53_9STRA|nr:AlNc14C55G4236 [Albugo laibachii Nc14]CCA25198.1 AlNc14C281G10110 [Albugo laibachii Nc14]|eukprot:CCA25198.1 AlNc14C281G10110 [Albugo laibachii Nc14]
MITRNSLMKNMSASNASSPTVKESRMPSAPPHTTSTSSYVASSPSSTSLTLWQNRMEREYQKCRAINGLFPGISLRQLDFRKDEGICFGVFDCFVPFQNGSSALDLIPLIRLIISTPSTRKGTNERAYPYTSPIVYVHCGHFHISKDFLREGDIPSELKKFSHKESDCGKQLMLPSLEHWTPSCTIPALLNEFAVFVQKSDPQPSIQTRAKSPSDHDRRKSCSQMQQDSKRMCIRKRDVRGHIHYCYEMDPQAKLVAAPLVIQGTRMVLLDPDGSEKQYGISEHKNRNSQDVYYVRDIIHLKDVTRFTPQHGKALMIFFKEQKRCRIFMMDNTDSIIQRIKETINSSGVKLHANDRLGNNLAQLLPFLSSEQSERAKEISNKFITKIGNYATSFTKFLKGEDPYQIIDEALYDLAVRRKRFMQRPSLDQLQTITKRYWALIQQFSTTNDGEVEKILGEFIKFLDIPAVRKILLDRSKAQ